jgi:hypothetical protein
VWIKLAVIKRTNPDSKLAIERGVGEEANNAYNETGQDKDQRFYSRKAKLGSSSRQAQALLDRRRPGPCCIASHRDGILYACSEAALDYSRARLLPTPIFLSLR